MASGGWPGASWASWSTDSARGFPENRWGQPVEACPKTQDRRRERTPDTLEPSQSSVVGKPQPLSTGILYAVLLVGPPWPLFL